MSEFATMDGTVMYPRHAAVKVNRWFKNGDHPGDGNPKNEGAIVGYLTLPSGERALNKGALDGVPVNPGDYIVTFQEGARMVLSPEGLREQFTAIG